MTHYFFTLQILSNGVPVDTPVGLEAPFERGTEALRWYYRRDGWDDLPSPSVTIQPVWKNNAPPLVDALEFSTPDRRHVVRLDATKLFLRDARRTSTRLVRQKALEEGAEFTYQIAAHQRGEEGGDPSSSSLLRYEFIERPETPPSLAAIDGEFHHEPDIEVFVEEQVLLDSVQLAREAGDEEAGSILLGQLCRTGELADATSYLHLTALVPAAHGNRAKTSFEFTPQCFNRARAILEERNRGEIFCGWQHNHPDLCSSKCAPEERERCPLRTPFLSEPDLLLQETVFPAPFHVALLVSHDGKKLSPSLWGWRDGFIARRSFTLTNTLKES